jgi:hypothetical protein
MVMGAGGQLGKLAGGITSGDFGQVMEAMRAGGPVAVRNLIKGYEQASTGAAWDARGQKLTDVGLPFAMFQAVGVSSGALTKMYDHDAIDRQTKAFYQQVSADFTHQMVLAMRAGDAAKAQEVWDAMSNWDQANPDMPVRMSAASVRRSIMMAGMPLNERTKLLMPRAIRGTATD